MYHALLVAAALCLLGAAAQPTCSPPCANDQYCTYAVGYGVVAPPNPSSTSATTTAAPAASASPAANAGVCITYQPLKSACTSSGFKCGANPATGDASIGSAPFVQTQCLNNRCCGIGCTGGCDVDGFCLDSCSWPPPVGPQAPPILFDKPPSNYCFLSTHPGLGALAPAGTGKYTCKLGFTGGGSQQVGATSIFYPFAPINSDCVPCYAGATTSSYGGTCKCAAGTFSQPSPSTGAVSCVSCPDGFTLVEPIGACFPTPSSASATNGLLGTILALMIIGITVAALSAFGFMGGALLKSSSFSSSSPSSSAPCCSRVTAMCKRPTAHSAPPPPMQQQLSKPVLQVNPLSAGLPHGWIECGPNESGQRWYTNSVTGVTQWERPVAA